MSHFVLPISVDNNLNVNCSGFISFLHFCGEERAGISDIDYSLCLRGFSSEQSAVSRIINSI